MVWYWSSCGCRVVDLPEGPWRLDGAGGAWLWGMWPGCGWVGRGLCEDRLEGCHVGRPLIKCCGRWAPLRGPALLWPPVRIVRSTVRLWLCYVFFGWVLFGSVWFPWFGYGWAGGSMAPRVGDRPRWSSRPVTTPIFVLCLFGVDGQLAQVSRMGFYFGRCSCRVHGIVGRACGLSLVFPYSSALVPPVLRLFVWSGVCAL